MDHQPNGKDNHRRHIDDDEQHLRRYNPCDRARHSYKYPRIYNGEARLRSSYHLGQDVRISSHIHFDNPNSLLIVLRGKQG